jgi:hypothetical protein
MAAEAQFGLEWRVSVPAGQWLRKFLLDLGGKIMIQPHDPRTKVCSWPIIQ